MKNIFLKVGVVFVAILMANTPATKANITRGITDYNHVSSWAKTSVENLESQGVISGDEIGEFSPQLNVTRAEFAKMIVIAFDIKSNENSTKDYSDITGGEWFYEYVATASCVMKGDGISFRPHDYITREEVAVIIDRVLCITGGLHFQYADKNEVSSWAVDSISNVTTKQIMSFYNDEFNPKQNCTREMTAVIIDRAMVMQNKGATKVNITEKATISNQMTERYMLLNVTSPEIASVGGEWAVIGFALNNAKVTDDFYLNYWSKASEYVVNQNSLSERKFSNKITDAQRIAIAMTASGFDPKVISGELNLIDYTWNKAEKMPDLSENQQKLGERQGLNELIYGLICIDLDEEYTYENANITRDEITELILEYQAQDGGFNSVKNSKTSDVDYTSMAIYALSKYDLIQVDTAIMTLSELQLDSGGFSGNYNSDSEIIENSESLSQVIMAFSSLKIDIHEYFTLQGKPSPIEALLEYQKSDGSFAHMLDGESDQMATEQAYIALGSYLK